MNIYYRSATLFLAASVALALLSGCGGSGIGTSSGIGSGSSGSGSSGSSGSGSGSSSGSSGSGSSGSGSSGSGSGGSASYPSPVPSDAISVSGIQALDNWNATYDPGTGGGSSTSSGMMSLVTAPSKSGQAREFVTTFTNSGGERYYVSFGSDTTSTNFFYDVWVYLPDSPTAIANLEFDMNQVMPNGQVVIFGFQCDGYSSTWDYTENAGTPESPVDQWVKSSAPCNIHNWSTKVWHHLQVSYSRDSSGNVNYKSVWLDDIEQTINATVPSAFALGWSPTLLTNFQVDGLGTSGSSTVYLDELTVYRW